MATKYTSFRLTDDLNILLDKIKAQTGASKTFIIKKAVEEYYKKLNKEDKWWLPRNITGLN